MIVFLQVYSFSLSLPVLQVSIKFINTFFYVYNMPNLDPWVNQNNNDYEDMQQKQ